MGGGCHTVLMCFGCASHLQNEVLDLWSLGSITRTRGERAQQVKVIEAKCDELNSLIPGTQLRGKKELSS